MSVYKRDYDRETDPNAKGDEVWAYSFKFRKMRYRKSGFRTKRDAEFAEAKAREGAMWQGATPTVGGDIGFTALVEKFFETRHLIRAPRTIASETQKAKVLKKFFGNRPISRITIGAVEQYRDQRLHKGRRPRTINLELVLLRCLFKYAIDHGLAQVNPARSVKDLKVPKTDKPIPTDQELHRLIEEAGKTPSGRQMVVWVWVSALTGLRPSEQAFLEWADIDFQGGIISVRPKPGNPLKTGRWRPVEINEQLAPVLGQWRVEWDRHFADLGRSGEHDWVFFNPRKPGQRCETFRKSFEEACRKAGLKDITMYSMRHYFISKALMSGVDIFTVTKWVGHSSTKMITEVYGHLSPTFRKGQMAKIRIEPAAAGNEHQKSA